MMIALTQVGTKSINITFSDHNWYGGKLSFWSLIYRVGWTRRNLSAFMGWKVDSHSVPGSSKTYIPTKCRFSILLHKETSLHHLD